MKRVTKKEHLRILFNRANYSHKSRGLDPIDYEYEEFEEWANNNGYNKIYIKWKRNKFSTYLAPSLDRLNTTKGYHLDNLEIVTWRVNQDRAYADRKNSVGRMALDNKKVVMLSMTYEYKNTFLSISDASRKTGVHRPNIASCISGSLDQAGGYRWVDYEVYKTNKNRRTSRSAA